MRNKDVPHVARQCLLDHGQQNPPVDLLEIAKAERIKVIRNSDTHVLEVNELGKILSDGTAWIIVYEDTQNLEGKRFTVAHELGHYFLRHKEELERLRRRQEKQADLFAAYLLNPQGGIYESRNT